MNSKILRLLTAGIVLSLPITAANADAIRIQNANLDQVSNTIFVKGVTDAIVDGTPVYLINAENGALLASDLDGNKQINLRAQLPGGTVAPCTVVVRAGALNSSDAVTAISQIRHATTCPAKTLRLKGQVVDDPIPFATVTVKLGGISYTTVADANGFYAVDVATASIQELVTIEATKKMTSGQTIDLVSLPGSFTKLLEDSTGGVLSSDTYQKVNVTNVSTAEYVLLVEANGGAAPTNLAQLQQAETQVDATELLKLAAVIKLIVDEGVPLPTGYSTVLAFVQNGPVDSFVSANATAIDAAIQEILTSNGLVAGFRIADIPGRYYVTDAVEPGFLPRSGSVLEFSSTRPGDCSALADGCTGLVMFRDPSGIPVSKATNWYLNNGVLEIKIAAATPASQTGVTDSFSRDYQVDPVMTGGTRLSACNPQSQVFDFKETLVGYSLTRYSDGQAIDSLSQRTAVFLSDFGPITCSDNTTRTIANFAAQPVASIMARDSGSIVPRRFVRASAATGAPDEIIADGQWAMQVFASLNVAGSNPANPRTIFSDNVTLSDGGIASAILSNEVGVGPSSWTTNVNGELVLTYPDGWSQTVVVTDALDVNGDGTVDEYVAFSIFTGPGGRFGSSELTFKRNTALFADEAFLKNPLNKYWQTVVNAWRPSAWEDVPNTSPTQRRLVIDSGLFGWRPAPVGAGFQGSYSPGDAGCTSGYWFRRPLTDFALQSTGILNLVAMQYFQRGNYRDRSWSVLATSTVGSKRRVYVIELERFPKLTGEPYRIAPRPNIYVENTEPNVDRGLCLFNNGFMPTP